MQQEIVDFLTTNTMCVLAVVLPDGTPHTAAMRFVYQDGVLYFSTHNTSRKVDGIHPSGSKASVTVGFSEVEWKTVQLEGTLEQIQDAKAILIKKYPDLVERIDATSIFFKFTPTWYRYTDYSAHPPVFIENQ